MMSKLPYLVRRLLRLLGGLLRRDLLPPLLLLCLPFGLFRGLPDFSRSPLCLKG